MNYFHPYQLPQSAVNYVNRLVTFLRRHHRLYRRLQFFEMTEQSTTLHFFFDDIALKITGYSYSDIIKITLYENTELSATSDTINQTYCSINRHCITVYTSQQSANQ